MKKKEIYSLAALGALAIGGATYFLLSQQDQVMVSGVAYRQSDQTALKGETITLRQKDKAVAKVKTDDQGYFHVRVDRNKPYSLEGNGFRAALTASSPKKIEATVQNGDLELGYTQKTETGSVTLAPSVIYVDARSYQTTKTNNIIVVKSDSDIKSGDTIYLPAQDQKNGGSLKRVREVHSAKGEQRLKLEDVQHDQAPVYEVVNQETLNISDFDFKPAVGVEVVSDKKAAVTQLTYTDKNGAQASVGISGTVSVDLNWKEDSKENKVVVEPNLTTKWTFDYKGEATSLDKELGIIPLETKTGVTIPVKLKLSFASDGKTEVKATVDEENKSQLTWSDQGLESAGDENHHYVMKGSYDKGMKLGASTDLQVGYAGASLFDVSQANTATIAGQVKGDVDIHVTSDKQDEDQFASGQLEGKGSVRVSSDLSYEVPNKKQKDKTNLYNLEQQVDKLKPSSHEKDYASLLTDYKALLEAVKSKGDLSKYRESSASSPSHDFAAKNMIIDFELTELYYAFYDVDGDGSKELILSTDKTLPLVVYAIKDGQATDIVGGAATHSYRTSVVIDENNDFVFASWAPGSGDGIVKRLRWKDGQVETLSEDTFRLRENPKYLDELKAQGRDLSKLDWKDVQSFSTDGQESSTKETPASSTDSAKKEEEKADKSETKSDKKEESSDSKEDKSDQKAKSMNLDQIRKKDFSSIAGDWKTEKGHTLTFDKKGITNIPEHEMILDKDEKTGSDKYVSFYLKAVGDNVSTAQMIVLFMPANVTLEKDPYGLAASDESRDRILVKVGDGPGKFEPYYRK